ncbi:caspase family protein [Spirillospora sp. CA-142024]|uniref:caspase family protein n=1 Tax=Spirillospora sp. CA-142024 TaxID=3240036 RepID=UPI003D90C3BC
MKAAVRTIFERALPGRRTHALVIGVGAYPHCGGQGVTPLAQRVEPLSCAPVTAHKVARWLLEHQRSDTAAPLASMEVLISPYPGRSTAPIEGTVPAAATYDNVIVAFDRWLERCNQDEDSVALFYFCGHGLARDPSQQFLLLEDFHASKNRPFDHAVDYGATWEGMAGCRARTQVFFLDTCREIPEEVLEPTRLYGRALIAPIGKVYERTSAVTVYATAHGYEAFSPPDAPTPFSEAVLDTLGGLGARCKGTLNGPWHVTTDALGDVARVLSFHYPDAPQRSHHEGESSGADVLRELSGPPRVPLRLRFDPGHAIGSANLEVFRTTDRQLMIHWDHRPTPWTGHAEVGHYEVRATFNGAPWRDIGDQILVDTPVQDTCLYVKARP